MSYELGVSLLKKVKVFLNRYCVQGPFRVMGCGSVRNEGSVMSYEFKLWEVYGSV
jgi:hypothetical protein